LRLTSRIDIDDLTQTTAAGLHLATMGSVWQALAFGFAGVRPDGDALLVDPRLPPDWRSLELRLRFRGAPLAVRIEPNELVLTAGSPVLVRIEGRPTPVEISTAGTVRIARRGTSRKEVVS
jgi:trehalose/maltose hydrolase-like predicted phosphorylase